MDLQECRAVAEKAEAGGRKNYGRRDVEIVQGSRVRLVIENKIDSPLGRMQLVRYQKTRTRSRIGALIRSTTIRNAHELAQYRVHSWSDLYSLLEKSARDDNQVDAFVANQLMTFLEAHGMNERPVLSRTALGRCAEMIWNLRYKKDPWVNLDGQFDDLSDWIRFVSSVREAAAGSRHLVAGVGSQFRASPKLGNWYIDDSDEKALYPAWFGIWLRLKKPYNGVTFLTFGLWVRQNENWGIEASALDKNRDWVGNRCYWFRKKDYAKEHLRREVLKRWNRWLGLKATSGIA